MWYEIDGIQETACAGTSDYPVICDDCLVVGKSKQ